MNVIMGSQQRAPTPVAPPRSSGRARPALLAGLVLFAGGCTLTAGDFEPQPLADTETGRLGGGEAPAPPPAPPSYPSPVLDPGELQPPVGLFPPTSASGESAGAARPGDTTEPRDAGAEPADADAANPSALDGGATPPEASPSGAAEAGAPPNDAGAPPEAQDAGPAEPAEPAAEPEPPAEPCPGLVFEDGCYEFFGEPLDWYTAERRCVDWGGHLATVESLEEDAFIGIWPSLLGLPLWDGSGLWLGGTDAQRDGDFRWWDDRPPTFLGWAPDQPNNGQGVDCIEKRNDPTQRWYDRRCTDRERYVCERPR